MEIENLQVCDGRVPCIYVFALLQHRLREIGKPGIFIRLDRSKRGALLIGTGKCLSIVKRLIQVLDAFDHVLDFATVSAEQVVAEVKTVLHHLKTDVIGRVGHLQCLISSDLRGVLVASAFLVIALRNPVHSVLFLILSFFNAAGLFVLTGAEFLAMILVIVYVGAVAVLFLFVVMMLDIDFAELRSGFMRYLPIGGLIGFILLAELMLVFGSWVIAPGLAGLQAAPLPANAPGLTNTRALGDLLYTRYIFAFQAAGLILLVRGRLVPRATTGRVPSSCSSASS